MRFNGYEWHTVCAVCTWVSAGVCVGGYYSVRAVGVQTANGFILDNLSQPERESTMTVTDWQPHPIASKCFAEFRFAFFNQRQSQSNRVCVCVRVVALACGLTILLSFYVWHVTELRIIKMIVKRIGLH